MVRLRVFTIVKDFTYQHLVGFVLHAQSCLIEDCLELWRVPTSKILICCDVVPLITIIAGVKNRRLNAVGRRLVVPDWMGSVCPPGNNEAVVMTAAVVIFANNRFRFRAPVVMSSGFANPAVTATVTATPRPSPSGPPAEPMHVNARVPAQ